MKNIYSTVLLLLCFCASTAQIELTNIVHQSQSELPILDGFVIKHPKDEGFAIVLNDGVSLYLNGFDQNSKYLSRIAVPPIDNRNRLIASMATEDGKYHLFFNTSKSALVTRQTIDFSKESVTTHAVELNLAGQEVLGTYREANMLHILTASRNQPTLHHHTLTSSFEPASQRLDLSDMSFKLENSEVAFNELFFQRWEDFSALGFDGASPFPTTLPEATRTSKVYRQGKNLIFTIDRNPAVTQLLTVDLEKGTLTKRTVSQLDAIPEKRVRQSNSYLKDTMLYQIIRTKDSLHLHATNWQTGESVNSYASGPSEEVALSNTAVLQVKPSKRKRKEVDGDKFLRSLNYDPIGVVVNEVNGLQQVTYGSWNESRGNSAKLDNSRNSDLAASGAMMGMFGLAGGLLYYALSSGGNSAQSYGLHHRGMATRAIGVFDAQFNHLPREGVQATIYHKIDYYNARRDDTTPLLLFQLKDQIIYGSFYPAQNAVKLLKF